MGATYRLANDQQRTAIIGATGSGKTFAANWNLANRDFVTKPWVIIDFKYDELINGIDGAVHLGIGEPVPTSPGIYVYHPIPQVDDENVERILWEIWGNENTGLYIDEAYMVNRNSKALTAIITQGRSKNVPIIILSQRPTWINPFVVSESEFLQIFRLQRLSDEKFLEDTVRNPLFKDPKDPKKRINLPAYHSYYYDGPNNNMQVVGPAPDRDAILDTFNTKLRKIDRQI